MSFTACELSPWVLNSSSISSYSRLSSAIAFSVRAPPARLLPSRMEGYSVTGTNPSTSSHTYFSTMYPAPSPSAAKPPSATLPPGVVPSSFPLRPFPFPFAGGGAGGALPHAIAARKPRAPAARAPRRRPSPPAARRAGAVTTRRRKRPPCSVESGSRESETLGGEPLHSHTVPHVSCSAEVPVRLPRGGTALVGGRGRLWKGREVHQ